MRYERGVFWWLRGCDVRRIGVLEGRVPSRPACSVLMPMVEMELDLPVGGAALIELGVCGRVRIVGLWRVGFHPGQRALY